MAHSSVNSLFNPTQVYRLGLVIFFIGACLSTIHATHNRAGEITYKQIDELTIEATIITYTRTSSVAADRDSLTLFWGDGDSTSVIRTNGTGFELPNDIKRNEYTAQHTYPARGTYKLSVTDPNRIAGILNVDFPNSVNIRFYIETTFSLLDPRFKGSNSSAELLQPPIDFACVGETFTYNPNAFDVDGDSLSYALITPFSSENVEVPNYELPDRIASGDDNQITLNEANGDFIWNAPQVQGEYNITYRINEYREGVLINSIIRDMQILVRACPDNDNPPEIELVDEICVIAGELVVVDILATDMDTLEILAISASGGPFEIPNDPAVLILEDPLPVSKSTARIEWQTTCDHVAETAYQIVVKATDNFGLATLKTLTIKVVAPPPQGVEVSIENGVAIIQWRAPYQCEMGENFRGFSIWRRSSSATVPLDTCNNNGLSNFGYERVLFQVNELEDGVYVARDPTIGNESILCYRVTAEFSELTSDNNPFNRTESLPSEESCIRANRVEPLITNVSVESTSADQGEMLVKWLNPDTSVIDVTQLTGPYQLTINRIGSNNERILIESFGPYQDVRNLLDTQVVDTNLNTQQERYTYEVVFSSGSGDQIFESKSNTASSVFLTTSSGDERIFLNWEEQVPWNNFQYVISQEINGIFNVIDTVVVSNYTIENLTNGTEFCYRIESLGKYGISEVREPIINLSNVSCATPRDNEAPCAPAIEVISICDETSTDNIDLINTITWMYEGDCGQEFDISEVVIYYSETENESLQAIEQIAFDQLEFDHVLQDNIAGCYAVSAIDSSGNESIQSAVICVDNCPNYILPNAFTPNNDGSNDVFKPRVNRFIANVEFEVFNRWGNKVFFTNDPNINWNGENLGNKRLSEGTYYYTCRTFERRVSGIVEGEVLKGTIQLIR